jgi:hypothetical protein
MKKNHPGIGGIYSFVLLLSSLFSYCTDGNAQTSAKLKFSNSYVNITRNVAGGTVQPGDVLEIRTTLYINSTYNGTGMIYYLRYVDNLPTNTSIVGGSTLNLITNEGLIVKNYSQIPDADAGTFVATPPVGEFQLKINMGGFPFSADPTAPANNTITDVTGAGNLRGNNNKPKFGGGTLVSTAFRVQVTGSIGDTITLGDGHLAFKQTNLAGDPDTVINALQYKILIAADDSVCSNTIGTNFADEFGGTFGSGNTLNRSTAPSFAIPGYTYIPNVALYPSSVSVNDGYYAIVNNSSPKSATNINSRRQPSCNLPAGPIPSTDSCNGRMFGGFWFISGDHTGTTDAFGNPPAAAGSTGGYMLEVNADIATTEAYHQTISGLCPDTYYEFSAWVKNICPLCGIDSSGAQTWKPGVLPNLTFVVDSIDRYSSGQIDTLGWEKKGFLFKTNPGQTSITVSIRDNAPGGGGNDWVLDDITLATCSPNLAMLPSPVDPVCYGNQVDISSLVSSHFDNYIYWQWEKSTDMGATWTNTGVSGTGSPVLVSGEYQYTALYPSFLGDSSAHHNLYRIRVASSAVNLSDSNCSFSASTFIQIYVNSCMDLLNTKLKSFNAQNQHDFGYLSWITEDETAGVQYDIEKSTDAVHFIKIGSVAGNALGNTYTFTDKEMLKGVTYYRIKIVETGGKYIYSKAASLNTASIQFDIKSLVNPFDNTLSFNLVTPSDRQAFITVSDSYGKIIRHTEIKIYKGLNPVSINDLNILSSGTYLLRIQAEGQTINKQIVKLKK